tara:strand:+ start:3995 stop:5449 length:1455 start_codon:yes stop_codon:yes gene_type:complete
MVNQLHIFIRVSFFAGLVLFSKSFAESPKTFFSGYIDYTYIARQSDQSLINIPYRMGSLNLEREQGDILLNSTFALEYHVREDSYFLSTSNPQDFILDMRELYLTYSSGSYEFRLGKMIHSWGSVDENSPIDNASSLDYYYMFFGGTDRKMGTLSGSLDYYRGNLKLNMVFSPLHSTNRIPLGDDDFPVELPVYPDATEIFPISGRPFEGGIHGTYSLGFGDISLSYFSGYDRTFNLSGVNVYGRGSDISYPYVDIVYGYRKTNVLGLGGVLLSDWFTLRFDVGYFSTEDKNKTIDRPSSWNAIQLDSLHFSYPLHEKAVYQQATLQIETELPFDINLSAQYFSHDTLSYSSDSLPVDQEINIPNLQIDPENMTPSNFFTPGMGVPIAILTKKAVFIVIDKKFYNNRLTLSLTSMIDIADYTGISGVAGSLTELKLEYSIMQNLTGLFGVTTVNGSNSHPDKELYPFNKMEDFSHTRFEIKYFF